MKTTCKDNASVTRESKDGSRESRTFAWILSLLFGVGTLVALSALAQDTSAQVAADRQDPTMASSIPGISDAPGALEYGLSWVVETGPNSFSANSFLVGVATLSKNNVWVVGIWSNNKPVQDQLQPYKHNATITSPPESTRTPTHIPTRTRTRTATPGGFTSTPVPTSQCTFAPCTSTPTRTPGGPASISTPTTTNAQETTAPDGVTCNAAWFTVAGVDLGTPNNYLQGVAAISVNNV